MRHAEGQVAGAVLAIFVLASGTGKAEENAKPAREPKGVTVWYRSVEGCPDGAQFLARLESRQIDARLARVGDPVDFVVTLGTGVTGSTGLLERQTSSGIVAVRTLEGETCDQVANALALTLVLVAEGHPTAPNTTEAGAKPVLAVPAPPVGSEGPTESSRHVPEPASGRDARAGTAAPAPPPSATAPEWLVGLGGTLTGGVTPALLLGGQVFGELGGLTPLGTAVRVGISAATASSTVGGDAFRLSLIAGRLEGCPAAIGATLRLTACAALDYGTVLTSGEGAGAQDDSAAWSALAFHGRLALHPHAPLVYEAELGAIVPLTRYELGATGQTVAGYRTAPVGFAAQVSIALHLP